VPLDEALAGGADDAHYRRVVLTGRWDRDATVLVRSRSLGERPGYHVVTPLVDGDGAVLVNRGFVPLLAGGEPKILDEVRPVEEGTVDVEGIVLATERRSGIGPRDRAGEVLAVVNRIDVARLQQQIDHELAPVYVQLTSPPPTGTELPIVLPEPATDEGPHFGYAMQWFIFATVGAIGWPLLLRKTAREQAGETSDQPA
jgi:cytochrome oxidase assembly protein ShyY1